MMAGRKIKRIGLKHGDAVLIERGFEEGEFGGLYFNESMLHYVGTETYISSIPTEKYGIKIYYLGNNIYSWPEDVLKKL